MTCHRPFHLNLLWIALLAGALVACEVDTPPSVPDAEEEEPEEPEICDWGPCDEPIEQEPREPEDLPGGESAAGEDPCGFDGHCRWTPFGAGTESPFEEGDLVGALIDDDGAITLDDESERRFFIWIANTDQGTVSKFDTETREEVARYRTGPTGEDLQPSRTTVNGLGEVFVANREGQRVTKIGLPPNCPSQSADGSLNTSSGPNDILGWEEDDCVIWSTTLPGHGVLRSIAAQDTEEGSFVWVGGWDHRIWKLDAETGQVIFFTESPVRPYGFALDEAGNLWIATFSGQKLGRVDTNVCRSHPTCDVEICDGGDGGDGDDCVKEVIEMPANGYGITVDHQQRVWVGGDFMRYDPAQPSGERWEHWDPGFAIHGITADRDGYVYGAAMAEGVIRVDAEDLSRSTFIPGTRNRSVKGIAVDFHDRVWAINLNHNDAFVIEPGVGLYDGQVIDQPTGLVGPYTYSDMTGTQLQFATDQRGIWRIRLEGCHLNEHLYSEWQTLRFEATAEGGSRLQWRVRGATRVMDLDDADWISLGLTPPLESPVDLRSALAAHGLARANHLEIEVRLEPAQQGLEFFVPRLEVMDVIAECPPIVN